MVLALEEVLKTAMTGLSKKQPSRKLGLPSKESVTILALSFSFSRDCPDCPSHLTTLGCSPSLSNIWRSTK